MPRGVLEGGRSPHSKLILRFSSASTGAIEAENS